MGGKITRKQDSEDQRRVSEMESTFQPLKHNVHTSAPSKNKLQEGQFTLYDDGTNLYIVTRYKGVLKKVAFTAF